jgi:hypothetical protein
MQVCSRKTCLSVQIPESVPVRVREMLDVKKLLQMMIHTI